MVRPNGQNMQSAEKDHEKDLQIYLFSNKKFFLENRVFAWTT